MSLSISKIAARAGSSFGAILLASIAFAADPLPAPEGDAVLTVSGKIAVTNAGDKAAFDIAMLKDMPATTFETTTIWTEGTQSFTGVSLAALLERLGVGADAELKAIAANDYAVSIPASDGVEGGPIIAYLNNGEEMSRREKGPLWVVYPFDSNMDYRTEVIYSRSIWQLDRISVE